MQLGNKLMTIEEVCEVLQCSTAKFYRTMYSDIPRYRFGRLVRYDPDVILAFIQSNEEISKTIH